MVGNMAHKTSPSNYQTCICGRECKGISALATHGRACPQEQLRVAVFLYCASNKEPMPTNAQIVASQDKLTAFLNTAGYLDAP